MYIMSYKEKYLKYKTKYSLLKEQIGGTIDGTPKTIEIQHPPKHFEPYQTLGDCVKEIIEGAYKLYNEILELNIPTTIICGEQSPAYFCLAILNFKIYEKNKDKVNIIILPYLKEDEEYKNSIKQYIKWTKDRYIDDTDERKQKLESHYISRLRFSKELLKNNIIIIDCLRSRSDILSIEKTLNYLNGWLDIKIKNVKKYGISSHYQKDTIKRRDITFDKEYIFYCDDMIGGYDLAIEPFPNLIPIYKPPYILNENPLNNELILDNPIAQMIIDIAKDYATIPIENSEWYKLNHNITEELESRMKHRVEYNKKLEENHRLMVESKGKTFKPETSEFNDGYIKYDMYVCPECKGDTKFSRDIIKHEDNCSLRYQSY